MHELIHYIRYLSLNSHCTAKSEADCIQGIRAEFMLLVKGYDLARRNNGGMQFVELIGLHGLGTVAHVGPARAVYCRELVIQPNGEVILIGDLLPSKGKDPGIAGPQ